VVLLSVRVTKMCEAVELSAVTPTTLAVPVIP
jgi:hypothetical protein